MNGFIGTISDLAVFSSQRIAFLKERLVENKQMKVSRAAMSTLFTSKTILMGAYKP